MSEAKALATTANDAAPAVVQSEDHALLSMIERAARDPNVDIDKMERLFDMQQKAEQRRAKAQFLADFARLQAELPAVVRRGKGHNAKSYARYEDVSETIRAPMSKHGFSLSFRVATGDNQMIVTGVLGHAGGHTEETAITLPADTSGNKNAVQAWGSSSSYGRRYVALALLGIATEDEDDDGKLAGNEPITEEQCARLCKLVADAGADMDKVLAFASVESPSEIPQSKYAAIVAKLARQRGK